MLRWCITNSTAEGECGLAESKTQQRPNSFKASKKIVKHAHSHSHTSLYPPATSMDSSPPKKNTDEMFPDIGDEQNEVTVIESLCMNCHEQVCGMRWCVCVCVCEKCEVAVCVCVCVRVFMLSHKQCHMPCFFSFNTMHVCLCVCGWVMG